MGVTVTKKMCSSPDAINCSIRHVFQERDNNDEVTTGLAVLVLIKVEYM